MNDSLERSALTARLKRSCYVPLAVAALALAGAGRIQTAPGSTPSDKPGSKMQHFVIIFRQGPRTLTEADKTRRQEEVTGWARVQNAAGHKLEPRILAPEVLRPGADTTHGTGVAAGEWPITALLFLEARDLAEAAKVAGTHPANHFGASVEVRPWAPPPAPPPAVR